MINVLKRAATAVLHNDPKPITSQIATMICDYIWMYTVSNQKNLLLNYGKIVTSF